MRIFILLPIALLLALTLISCTSEMTVTETVQVTQTVNQTETIMVTETQTIVIPPIGQVLDISIEPAPGNYLVKKILLESVSVTVGTYGQAHLVTHTPGDPCLVVSGTMTNEDDTAWQIAFYATGYKSNGISVSGTLDSGFLVGRLSLIIPAKSSSNFTIHLSWNEDVHHIRLYSSRYSAEVPLP